MNSTAAWLIAAALVILAALGIAWTIMLVSLLAELKRTSQGVRRVLESDVPSTLAEIRDAARSLTHVARDVGEATPHLRATLEALEEVGENVRTATGTVRGLLGYRFIPVAGILAGLRTGLRYAWRIYKRRES